MILDIASLFTGRWCKHYKH